MDRNIRAATAAHPYSDRTLTDERFALAAAVVILLAALLALGAVAFTVAAVVGGAA